MLAQLYSRVCLSMTSHRGDDRPLSARAQRSSWRGSGGHTNTLLKRREHRYGALFAHGVRPDAEGGVDIWVCTIAGAFPLTLPLSQNPPRLCALFPLCGSARFPVSRNHLVLVDDVGIGRSVRRCSASPSTPERRPIRVRRPRTSSGS